MKRTTLLIAIALTGLLTGVAASLLYARYGSSRPEASRVIGATVLQPAKPLQPFELTAPGGERFDLDRLRGHWSFLFFGYTYCPDVCPTTLSVMREAVTLIRTSGKPKPQVFFVSIDPQRDTPAQLARYTAYFDPDFVGVATTQESLPLLTGQLGVLYIKVENAGGAGYLMDHTASAYLINPEGGYQALFAPPHDPSVIAADYAIIVERYE